eukprot:m.53227 g.53227  ORF g.53227 m.53227 type:complete len:460 (-) comp21728_c0_seq2:114-1493(-)
MSVDLTKNLSTTTVLPNPKKQVITNGFIQTRVLVLLTAVCIYVLCLLDIANVQLELSERQEQLNNANQTLQDYFTAIVVAETDNQTVIRTPRPTDAAFINNDDADDDDANDDDADDDVVDDDGKGDGKDTKVVRTLHVCGYSFQLPLAMTLFPDFRIVRTVGKKRMVKFVTAKATKDDILMVSGGCEAVSNYPGRVLYVDGEPGQMPIRQHPRMYYIGLAKPPRPVIASVPVTFAAISTQVASMSSPCFSTSNSLLQPRAQPTPHPKFLGYVNRHCVAFREEAFDQLVALAAAHQLPPPVALGTCHGSHAELQVFNKANDRNNRLENCKILREYRFVITMENANVEGYMSEKIVDAFMASTIPVFYGDKGLALDMFNEKAFVYYNISNPQPALDRILHLETNTTAYAEALAVPILKEENKTLEKYFSLDDDVGGASLKKRIRDMLELDIDVDVKVCGCV